MEIQEFGYGLQLIHSNGRKMQLTALESMPLLESYEWLPGVETERENLEQELQRVKNDLADLEAQIKEKDRTIFNLNVLYEQTKADLAAELAKD